MNLNKRFEEEKEMIAQIESIEKTHELTLRRFIASVGNNKKCQEQADKLKILDLKIDSKRKSYEAHVEKTNQLIYGKE